MEKTPKLELEEEIRRPSKIWFNTTHLSNNEILSIFEFIHTASLSTKLSCFCEIKENEKCTIDLTPLKNKYEKGEL